MARRSSRSTASRRASPGASGLRPLVVKVGGREVSRGASFERFLTWVDRASQARPLVIVHGGGDEVSALADRVGLPTRKVEGQRVTSAELLPLVEGVLCGPVNLRLASALSQKGLLVLGLSGVSSDTVVAQDVRQGALGFVGEPVGVNVRLLRDLLGLGIVPIFAPLASDGRGGVLNVNADLFASSLACALRGDLLLVTDVPGVRGADGSYFDRLTPQEVHALRDAGTIAGGMLPKVEAALQTLVAGGQAAWIGALVDGEQGPRTQGTWIFPDAARTSPGSPGPSVSSDPLLPPSKEGGL